MSFVNSQARRPQDQNIRFEYQMALLEPGAWLQEFVVMRGKFES
jgi:hypothetical protein